jgi:hypothetical protein
MSVSRKDLYSYVASMFVGIVKGIYKHMPTALSPEDTTNGFIVIRMGNIDDSSEFYGNTYAKTRIYVECYVPDVNTSTTNGVMSTTKYDAMQQAVDDKIDAECEKVNQTYTISRESILSSDDTYVNKATSFMVYITSFQVII